MCRWLDDALLDAGKKGLLMHIRQESPSRSRVPKQQFALGQVDAHADAHHADTPGLLAIPPACC